MPSLPKARPLGRGKNAYQVPIFAFFPVLLLVFSSACFQADKADLALLDAPVNAGAPTPMQPSSGPTQQPGTDAGPPRLGFLCDSPTKTDYHPPGYADSAVHGAEFKLGMDKCTDCHGEKLEGCNFAGGCDNCHDGGHPKGWRSNCTYCHGGETNDTGAPPADLLRDKPDNAWSFLAHDAHVVGTLHAPYDCTQCHTKPTDLLSPGHVLDATPGVVEVSFANGLSKDAKWDRSGTCSNVYCHGNRRANGTIKDDASATDCNSCHAFDDAKKLSGRHDAHINGGLLSFLFNRVACVECHADVVDKDGKIIGPALHVNGKVDLTINKQGITYDGTRCNGNCHNAPHTFISTWIP